MKKRLEITLVSIVAITIGTLMHFVHELPCFSHFMGYIFPVNECTWEHMKMTFYPLLLTSIYLCCTRKNIRLFGGMILSCCVAIPLQIILFYCYWPFTHHSILIVDIIMYVAIIVGAILVGNKWSLLPKIQKSWSLFIGLAVVLALIMGYWSYNAPDMFLFVVQGA